MKTFYSLWLQLLLLTVLALFKTAAFAQLHAGISATPQSGCPPVVVSFMDSSTGNPTSWKWDLGNGTISYLQNPVTTYLNTGSYNIKLVIKNANGADSIVKNKYIVVNAVPAAKFGSSHTGGCFPLDAQFTDSSLAGSGTITAWKWDFGDGTLSNEQNPLHTYRQSGSFTVVLKVTNSNGCTNVITKTAYIKIENGVKANFSYKSQPGCSSPEAVNFINETVGTGVLRYSWDFGDGKKSNERSPFNNYQSAGTYTVKLISSNGFGCADTMIKPDAINIGFVKANFTIPDTICAGVPFQLKNTSNPSTFVSSSWDFGDGTLSDTNNPIKTYAISGTYNVKLVTNFGSCLASVVKAITVLSEPKISFTAINNTGCKALDVTFKNTTNGGVSYSWNFGDNTTSTLENPVHTYQNPGEYTVTLTVKNTSGCSGTLIKTGFVKITPPKITSIENLPLKGCVPSTATPVAVIKDSVPGSSYLWNFGDGTTSTDSTPSHTYTTPGNYNIKLTITTPSGCTDTLTVVDAVQVGTAPVSQFSADPLDICANTPVKFTDTSSGATATKWLWRFGDGRTSTKQNPVHVFNSTGKFDITLIVSNYGCSDTLKKVDYIKVHPPIAKFDTAFRCNDPLGRDFIDKSIGAETWQWDFGDGVTSADQKVSHTYAGPGTYAVILKVTNGDCEHTIKKDVLVINEQGIVETSATESCINQSIDFEVKNVDSANIGSYTWYINGIWQPGIENGYNQFTYVYDTVGIRHAAVAVTDILECIDTLYTSVPVAIYGPKAGFGSSNPGTCFGNTVNFIDSTVTDGTHPIVNWVWSFGEGGEESYTKAPFSHNYSSQGSYNVKLVVKDTYGCTDSITKPSFISITNPIARFTPSDSVLCIQSPITFNNYSQGVGVTYFWQFGDGAASGELTPIHTYDAPGVYTVKMKMIDKNGCSDSAFANIKISAATVNFSLSDSFSTCPPLIVNTTNRSSDFASYNWDFGDGGNSQLLNPSHIYTYPGVYTIKLVIDNNGGCRDSLTRKVVIQGPTAVLDYTPKEACNPGKVDFSLRSQQAINYVWDYDDGTAIFSNKTTSSHTYTSPGEYVPKVILQDVNGCKVPLAGTDTIKIVGIETHFNSENRLLCDSGYIAFKDSTISNDIVNSWKWNFGDGTTSSHKSPNHKFTDTGFYTITLISKTKTGCSDTAVNQKYIKIVSSPQVTITGDTAACEPGQLKFQGEFVKTDTSAVKWFWSFGNGKTANVQIPGSQTYTTAGAYPVILKVTNSSGCYDSVIQKAIIHPKPAVNAGTDTAICKFSSFTLHATGADSYTWTTQPSLSCTNCATPTVKPDHDVTYHVTGKTVFGCTNEDSIIVKVQQPFKIEVSKDDTICLGESVVLKATGGELFEWTPSQWLDKPKTGTPKSTPASSITYKVVGKDRLGCFKDQGNVNVKVYPKPEIEITNGESIVVQAGGNVKLLTKGSADITNWKWYPAKWLSCDSCSEPMTSPNDNTTYHVTATNEGHCEAHDEVTISIICNNANVYMPNTFSPNHDGSNDVFYPRGTGLYSIRSFKIFNRWGQIVFSKGGMNANNPQTGWDGTLNGVLLQPDVYVYILEVICSNNVTLPIKGNITLIR